MDGDKDSSQKPVDLFVRRYLIAVQFVTSCCGVCFSYYGTSSIAAALGMV
jgi:hypothetical protein